MTLLDSTTALTSTAAERAERLTAAGASWGSRIAADPANAQLTYRVRGRGEGSVASAITAGKHRFLVDEPAALAGDDLAARKLFGIDESVRAGFSDIRLAITAGKHRFLVDEPAALAGGDLAASPVEVALGALISCQIVVFRLYAHSLGIQVDDISVAAEGDLDARKLFGINESVRAGFSDIRLTITLTGPESDERYQQLRSVVDKHCPVLDLFVNPTPVSIAVVKG